MPDVQAPKLVSLHQRFQGSTGSPGSLSEKGDLETTTPVLTEQWRKRWMGAKEDEQIEIGPMIGRGGYGKVFRGDLKQGILSATAEASFQTMMRCSPAALLACWSNATRLGAILFVPDSVLDNADPASLQLHLSASNNACRAGRWKSTMVAVKVVEHSHIPKSNTNSPNPGFDKEDPASTEARVAREMLLSTSISHPNVVQTYKICTIRVGSVLDSGFPVASSAEVSPPTERHANPHCSKVAWLELRLAPPEGCSEHLALENLPLDSGCTSAYDFSIQITHFRLALGAGRSIQLW